MDWYSGGPMRSLTTVLVRGMYARWRWAVLFVLAISACTGGPADEGRDTVDLVVALTQAPPGTDCATLFTTSAEGEGTTSVSLTSADRTVIPLRGLPVGLVVLRAEVYDLP